MVFNSSIKENGFYMVLEESGSTMRAADIFGLFRYIWNRGIDYLKNIQVLDRYGRFKMPQEDALKEVLIESGLAYDEMFIDVGHPMFASPLGDALVRSVLMDATLADWTQVYPSSILQCPLRQLADRMVMGTSSYFRLYYRKLNDWDMDVIIPLIALKQDLKDIFINRMVHPNFMNLEIRMGNMLENSVKLVVESNTDRMDEFLNELSKSERYIIHSTLWISRSQIGAHKGKLLCSIIVNERS